MIHYSPTEYWMCSDKLIEVDDLTKVQKLLISELVALNRFDPPTEELFKKQIIAEKIISNKLHDEFMWYIRIPKVDQEKLLDSLDVKRFMNWLNSIRLPNYSDAYYHKIRNSLQNQ